MKLSRDQIAWRVAQDLKDGWYVNLGVGIPLRVASYIPKNIEVMLHSENGILGMGPDPPPDKRDNDLINAGKGFATIIPGSSFFDSSTSFSMIRAGHLDVAIMGAFQVSKDGSLANWSVPGQKIGGIGGAADLAVGAKRVWIAMSHTTEDGKPKIVEKCSFPLTGLRAVTRIYTDIAIIDVDRERGRLMLSEAAPGISIDYVKQNTGATLEVSAQGVKETTPPDDKF